VDLVTRRIASASALAGPLLFVEGTRGARLGELVTLRMPGLPERRGQVVELSEQVVAIQVIDETRGLAPASTEVTLTGRVAPQPVSRELLGRVLSGTGRPLDGLPAPLAEAIVPLHGGVMNPTCRDKPAEHIETGISAIDGLNTLERGQKLPIFSLAGLPASRLAIQIALHARVRGGAPFCVVFAAIGVPFRERDEYVGRFTEAGILDRTVVFLNRADDPAIERLMTPRCALAVAEHLAFTHGFHVLVVLTDMTNYCESLREVALARKELPGRRGYPGYMYTDLATIFERAGRLRGRPGSITQLPVLTMPDDDITHPIPDLTGYITEGQIVLSRDLDRRGVFPPIDVLPSLSRLMSLGIGPGRTREDHRGLADQLYAFYARGCETRRMAAIIGAANLGDEERRFLDFADRFERELIHQGGAARTIEETLAIGWRLLGGFPAASLTRIQPAHVERYLSGGSHGQGPDDPTGAQPDARDPAGGAERRAAAP
jgi:V/A-type H+-transporting ATPase subunit B